MRRHSSLLSWIAALGLLLHAATAAASIWCSMAGELSVSCCCPGTKEAAPDAAIHAPSDCCKQAIRAQEVENASHLALADAGPLDWAPAPPWDRHLLEPVSLDVRMDDATHPSSTPPPLIALATVVIVR
ncbi:hypothetical protein [Vulgatibacter incomptus]|uniref:Uncharacterized protein n=1 Tax=Vulgatibacter incomptus TaxID=1391653 RepID=A0A0K1PD28_9BACT|nr:hypothetical protein [Vulgatibacter incomptus]AKU91425.1 hypothetical protein AKJ08_1812 [Vulgatibacter incomptus]